MSAPPLELKIRVSPEARRLLMMLAEHGLFGSSPEETAERLLLERLREIVREGWAGHLGFSDGRTQPVVKLTG